MAMHRLTDEQREFAENNHVFVYKFLSTYKLPVDEYYDIAIFGYLNAVQIYLERDDLKQYAFSTIAYKCMRTRVMNLYRIKRIHTLSLDAPVGPEKSLLLGECVKDPKDDMECINVRCELDQYLSLLNQREKDCFFLKACGYTIKEIGSMYQTGTRAIGSSFYRARKKIRAAQEAAI